MQLRRILLSFVLALTTWQFVWAQDPLGLPDFSATQIAKVPPGVPEVAPLKVYKSGARYRTERAPGQIVIWDAPDDRVYRMLNGGANCVILPLKQAPMMSSALQVPMGTKVQRKVLGKETVDGHPVTVEQVDMTASDGTVLQSKMWEADDLKGFPLKIEALGHPSFSFQDIVLGTPDAALFNPPKNCLPLEKIKPKVIPTDRAH